MNSNVKETVIMRTDKLSKLYGRNKSDAVKLLKEGATKAEVLKKTGTTVALWDINLDIKEGEMFVIIGLSGSGKSTLVRCFNRLNTPTDGDVFFREQHLKTLTKDELITFRREKIAMVFQHFGLMSHRSVLGNVEYGQEIRGIDKE
jgi:glycine betaine/proline transport system ATP-binding protein